MNSFLNLIGIGIIAFIIYWILAIFFITTIVYLTWNFWNFLTGQDKKILLVRLVKDEDLKTKEELLEEIQNNDELIKEMKF